MTAPAPEPCGRWRTGSIAVIEPVRSRGTARACAAVGTVGTGCACGGPSWYETAGAAAGAGAYWGVGA